MRSSGASWVPHSIHRSSEVVGPAIHAGAVDIVISVELAHCGGVERVMEAFLVNGTKASLRSQRMLLLSGQSIRTWMWLSESYTLGQCLVLELFVREAVKEKFRG